MLRVTTMPILPVLLICFVLILPLSGKASDTEQNIIAPVEQSITILQKDQKKREQWQDEKEKLTEQLQVLQEVQKRLKKQKEDLFMTNRLYRERIAVKKKKIADISQISEQIEPFLQEVGAKTREMIENDNLPFLRKERLNRLEKLEKSLNSPEETISEKYRKMMETLLVEAEYGFTVETGQEFIDLNGQRLLVNCFRLGRLNLFYLTLDERDCGFFNVAKQRWQSLPADHLKQIRTAVAIAAKRQPAELLNLPVGRIISE